MSSAVEQWFGCCTTELGFARDIGAIDVWLIDWSASLRLLSLTTLKLIPASMFILLNISSTADQHAWWPVYLTELFLRFCCWTLIQLLRHWAWLRQGYWRYRSRNLIDWLISCKQYWWYCVTRRASFHDLYLSTKLFCSYLCIFIWHTFFGGVNVFLLLAMCPQCFKNCSVLDGVQSLFIVYKNHVEWNVVLRDLFEYLSDSIKMVYFGESSTVCCLLWRLMFTKTAAESIL